MQKLQYKNFVVASIITIIVSLTLFYFSYKIGKIEFFLLLNNDLGRFADVFFQFATAIGDGLVWIIVLLFFVLLLKKYKQNYFPLLITAFVISTLLVQICKYVIVPDEPRPIKAIADTHLIYTVPGVELHEISSFPSGHTATAFTIFLVGCLVIRKRWIVFVGFIYAISVAYSRIYLAQHFPVDLAAGMLVGIISVSIAILVQHKWDKCLPPTPKGEF
jgi:membrane-associated phospholipid phosphatase